MLTDMPNCARDAGAKPKVTPNRPNITKTYSNERNGETLRILIPSARFILCASNSPGGADGKARSLEEEGVREPPAVMSTSLGQGVHRFHRGFPVGAAVEGWRRLVPAECDQMSQVAAHGGPWRKGTVPPRFAP